MRLKNKKPKVEYIPNHVKSKCYTCEGKKTVEVLKDGSGEISKIACPTCKGTGIWIEKHWILVATDTNGQSIAFGVDTLK